MHAHTIRSHVFLKRSESAWSWHTCQVHNLGSLKKIKNKPLQHCLQERCPLYRGLTAGRTSGFSPTSASQSPPAGALPEGAGLTWLYLPLSPRPCQRFRLAFALQMTSRKGGVSQCACTSGCPSLGFSHCRVFAVPRVGRGKALVFSLLAGSRKDILSPSSCGGNASRVS